MAIMSKSKICALQYKHFTWPEPLRSVASTTHSPEDVTVVEEGAVEKTGSKRGSSSHSQLCILLIHKTRDMLNMCT